MQDKKTNKRQLYWCVRHRGLQRAKIVKITICAPFVAPQSAVKIVRNDLF